MKIRWLSFDLFRKRARRHTWPTALPISLAILAVLFLSTYLLDPVSEATSGDAPPATVVWTQYHLGPWVLLKTVRWIDLHNGTVTAIGTLVMAFFSFTLWFVTNKSVNLARAEFNATHRPRIIVQDVNIINKGIPGTLIDDGRAIDGHVDTKLIFTVMNCGELPAFIKEWRCIIYYQKCDTAFSPELESAQAKRPSADAPGIGAGEFELIGYHQITSISDDWRHFCSSAGGRMYFIGRVTYCGNDGVVRNTGFCRSYDRLDLGAWRKVADSEYEYVH